MQGKACIQGMDSAKHREQIMNGRSQQLATKSISLSSRALSHISQSPLQLDATTESGLWNMDRHALCHLQVWLRKISHTTWFSTFTLLSPAGWEMQGCQQGTLRPKGMVEPKVKEAWITKSPQRRLCTVLLLCALLHEKYTSTVVGRCAF